MRLIDADVAIEELTDRSHQAAKRVGTDSPFWEGLVIARRIVNNLPTIQPELTDEQAIAHLQSSGWMQRHDKEMYESGLKEQLADDSYSYDSLLPTVQPEERTEKRMETHACDLVSRQAAIHALCKAVHKGEDVPCENQTVSCLWTGTRVCDFVREIDALPSIQPEPQWIPVSERLPEDYVDVLVWFVYFRYGDYNCLYQTHGIGTYVAEYNSWMINHESGWKDLRVIAWIPLPEPYKGDEK